MPPQTSYGHAVSWGLWAAKTLAAQLLLLRVPAAQPRPLQQPGEGVKAAAANLLHQGDRSREEEEHCCRVSTHPSCRCQLKNKRRARGST